MHIDLSRACRLLIPKMGGAALAYVTSATKRDFIGLSYGFVSQVALVHQKFYGLMVKCEL